MRRLRLERTAMDEARYKALRRVPQKGPGKAELAAYMLVPALLASMGIMPSVAIFFMLPALPLLYMLFRRFGAFLPSACVGFYGLFSLVFNYDILTVVYFLCLFFALCGLMLSVQLKPYLLCITVAAVSAVVGALIGIGTVRLADGRPLGEVAESYVAAKSDDPYFRLLARITYDGTTFPTDIGKLEPADEGYDAAVVEYFAGYAKDDIGELAPYYCVQYPSIMAILAYFIAAAVNKRTCGIYDADADRQKLAGKTRCLGGVRRDMTPMAEMKFPRAYLWAVLLPGFIASLVIDIVGGYPALSATLMHTFVVVPGATAFATLTAFFASLFKGRARIAAYAVFFVLMAVLIAIPIALYVASAIGVCDVLLDLRFWTRYFKDDS